MLTEMKHQWQERERARISSGEYEPMPASWVLFFNEQSEEVRNKVYLNYFPHISKDEPSKIAYTENADKGERDIQSQIKPGRFLKKVLPDLADTEVQSLVQSFNTVRSDGELRFARTEEHIVFVYRNGPNSCMAHKTNAYSSKPVHPVSVYASGDLGVAYVENANNPEKVSARAVCNFKNKEYVRVYGEQSLIEPLLKKEGWNYSSAALNGARLLKRTNDYGDIVAPYLDGSYQDIETNGRFLHIGCGDMSATNTNGLLGQAYYCSDCEESIDPDDCRTYRDSDYCDSCFDHNYSYCAQCEEHYPHEEITSTNNGYHWVCDGCFERTCFTCGSCDENKTNNNKMGTHHKDGDIGKCCSDNYYTPECCDELVKNDEACDCETEEEKEKEEVKSE